MKNISFRLVAGIAGMAAAFPLTAFAATPQQVLTQALNASKTDQSFNLEVRAQNETREYKTWNKPDKLDVGLLFTVKIPKDQKKTGEGQILIKNVEVTGQPTYKDPLAIQWKLLDTVAYLRLEQIAPALLDELKKTGMDFPPSLIGQWVRFDYSASSTLTDVLRYSQNTDLLPSGLTQAGSLGTDATNKLSIFQALSLKNNATWDGKTALKITARLNPAFLAKQQQDAIRAIPRGTYYAQDVRTTNQTYATMRKAWTVPRFVFFIDPQTKKVQRMEFTYKGSEPVKTYTGFNEKTYAAIYKTTGVKTTAVTGGLSFLADGASYVEAPAASMTPEEFMNILTPATSSTDETAPINP